MNKMTFLVVSLFITLTLGCSSPQLADYQHTTPALKLEEFFNGKLVAHGMVLDYNGKLTRRFKADIDAHWQDNIGIIDEDFVYDDGETAKRVWRIEKQGNRYLGTANDVIGTASGQAVGAVLQWKYTLQIQVDGEPMDVELDDWMYLIDEQHLLNKSHIIKYGLHVGEVILSIRKL